MVRSLAAVGWLCSLLSAAALRPPRALAKPRWLRLRGHSSDALDLGLLAARLDRLEAENAELRAEMAALGRRARFQLVALGDLHLDPERMEAHVAAREEIRAVLAERPDPAVVVSVGDLGDKHEGMRYPGGVVGNAGCSACFAHARDYLRGFGVDYELITGNHDLEAMDEFASDEANLAAWLEAFDKTEPYFRKEVAHKTLLLGLSTTRFRDAPLSSHEVYVDDLQLDWFERQLQAHSAADGWKVLVFTHAPPMGSGVRALQSVHIKNGCAWINHTSDAKRRRIFLRLVQDHACVRAWFAGHFHLSHDYPESLGWGLGSKADDGGLAGPSPEAYGDGADAGAADPGRTLSGPAEQPVSRLGSHCLFVQLGVIGESSQRDGRRQTRLVRGDEAGLEIYTINHHEAGRLRHDATLRYESRAEPVPRLLRHNLDEVLRPGGEKWFSARTPRPDDGCYLALSDEDAGGVSVLGPSSAEDEGLTPQQKVCWWHMGDGKVLGVHDDMLIEYDDETLSPLGVVVEQLGEKEVLVIGGGEAVVLVGPGDADYEVLHPNEDGSYWRKFQKNKLYRTQSKAREALASTYFADQQPSPPSPGHEADVRQSA